MQEKKILLFDFDGVIIDSVAMVNRHALRYWDVDPLQQKEWAEGNVHAASIGGEVPEKLDEAQEKVTTDFFRDYANDMKECAVFPGMPDVLQQLAERYALYVVSSAPGGLIREYLTHAGVLSLFVDVYGMDVSLSKSVKVGMVLAREQASLCNALLITDTLGDVREARHAGIEAIGVTWGVHERHRLEKGAPWGICEIPAELPTAIDAYFAEV